MAYPTVPDQTYSYAGFSQSLGDGSFPGPAMDTDMAAISGSSASGGAGASGAVIIEW